MRVAILSVHSHRDRSFLDDRVLALVAGDLDAAGIASDLVAAFLDAQGRDPLEGEAFAGLCTLLEEYDVVVYERVWSQSLIEALRERLDDTTFVSCEGEHRLENPPADYVCGGHLRATVPALITHLAGKGSLPTGARAREAGGWRAGLGKVEPPSSTFRPNLHPRVVGLERWDRSFSIEGNAGCPYRADARENPRYEGVEIPARYGRGCAFCTTGNQSESAPPRETAEKVLTQLRYLRRTAPEIERLVLKDQNPFGWLTEVVESCVAEGLTGFSLLLETRADWFLRNQRRFERALELAERASIRLCPFLVGIENFSPPELERFNKGTTAEENECFLSMLETWRGRYPALDLSHAAFGFVLLTPWTRLEDLRANLEAVERTRFDRLRGHLLVARARLYPDTALFYLARRDGLLEAVHESVESDNARRYGYFPAAPWRFAHPEVARFAELAATLTRELGGKDQRRLWRVLLDALEGADDPREVTLETIRASSRGASGPDERPDESAIRGRLARLVRPLRVDVPFAGGWRFGRLNVRPGLLEVRLEHDRERPVTLEITPRRSPGEPGFARSLHYDLRHAGRELDERQRAALSTVCDAIARNDR